MAEITFLDLPAEPAARGAAHGEALRRQIHACYGEHMSRVLASPTARQRGIIDEDTYLAHAMRHRPAVEAFAPDLWEELRAIARAAELTPAHILAMNLHLEVLDLANPMAPDPDAGGCTTFALQRGDGSVAIGQTYDLKAYFEDAAFTFRTELPTGGTLAAMSFAGTAAAIGMNSHGLAIVINKLFGSDWRPDGVPYPFVVRRMLEQPTPALALSVLIPAARAASMHYLVADQEGLLYPIETSARKFDVMDVAEDGLYTHTNHFLSPQLKPLEARDFSGYAAHTITRLARSRQLLRRMGRDAPASKIQTLMTDEHNFPCGICATPVADGHQPTEGKTVGRALLEPSAGKAAFALGNAKANPFREILLG